MSTQINKTSTDWLLIKSWLNSKIDSLHRTMESQLTWEDYNAARGAISVCRELIAQVEPPKSEETNEETYGISDPNQGFYG